MSDSKTEQKASDLVSTLIKNYRKKEAGICGYGRDFQPEELAGMRFRFTFKNEEFIVAGKIKYVYVNTELETVSLYIDENESILVKSSKDEMPMLFRKRFNPQKNAYDEFSTFGTLRLFE